MKVTISGYHSGDIYHGRTNGGRKVNINLRHFPECLPHVGEYWKLRNDVIVEGEHYLPVFDYQWYQLDKTTGKKLHVVPDEM